MSLKRYTPELRQRALLLYRAVNDIDHTKAQAMSLQTNRICQRFHKKFYSTVTR